MELPNGIPSHDTFGRVLSLLDPLAFEQSLLQWVQANVKLKVGDIVPIDGKTLRGSHDAAHQQEAIEIVSAWAASQRLTLGQMKVSAASNEITAVPQVLDLLEVAGCTVTIDALHCQKTPSPKYGSAKRITSSL